MMQKKMVAIFALCALSSAQAAEPIDLSRLDVPITKEPFYTSQQPLYGLVVIGHSAAHRIWMVLDKSKPDAELHDVVYADLNGNGDLTDPKERFFRPSKNGQVKLHFPAFTDKQTGDRHTEFFFYVTGKYHMVSLRWKGDLRLGGGYAKSLNDGYMRFSTSVEDAPILWLNGDGPFHFLGQSSDQFAIGGENELSVILGIPGKGKVSFCAFQRYVLARDEPILATLIYSDRKGNQQRFDFELKERC